MGHACLRSTIANWAFRDKLARQLSCMAGFYLIQNFFATFENCVCAIERKNRFVFGYSTSWIVYTDIQVF